ncbi:hypothetical protein L7F22_051273 [Adiantum nelumboides]|nr:hypothetical protein [Adiantum nelumboides]
MLLVLALRKNLAEPLDVLAAEALGGGSRRASGEADNVEASLDARGIVDRLEEAADGPEELPLLARLDEIALDGKCLPELGCLFGHDGGDAPDAALCAQGHRGKAHSLGPRPSVSWADYPMELPDPNVCLEGGASPCGGQHHRAQAGGADAAQCAPPRRALGRGRLPAGRHQHRQWPRPIVGQAIAEHEGIDKVAFTGSTVTGKKVAVAAATSNLKRTTLELGGKSPAVVFEDADLEQAAHWVTNGILFNMGQDCAASSRLLVQKSIHDDFVARLVRNFEAHQIGDPFDDKTTQGPQVSEMQYKKILGLIRSGKEQGATVATGGDTVQFAAGHEYNGGYFVRPTIFTGCRKGMRIYDEEIFGPVLCVMAFDDEDDAVQRANDTTYGLGAGIFPRMRAGACAWCTSSRPARCGATCTSP